MAKIDNGGPAFPTERFDNAARIEPDGYHGMSLRDYFAAAALPAVVKQYAEHNGVGQDHLPRNCAIHAYRIADAMLSARKKETGT
jgi:hypothetical protein